MNKKNRKKKKKQKQNSLKNRLANLEFYCANDIYVEDELVAKLGEKLNMKNGKLYNNETNVYCCEYKGITYYTRVIVI